MSFLSRRPSSYWLAWIAISIAGCKSFFAPRGIPDDPLLLGKQPIESKGQITPYQPLVHREPMPPSQPLAPPALPEPVEALDGAQ